jgi:hypothetical protein
MHESALIFVPAATFGQLIPKCDTALQPPKVPKRIEIVNGWTSLWRRAASASDVSRTTRFAGKPGLFRRTHVGVGFNLVPLLFHNATQLSLHSFKCVVDDFFQRFVSAVIHLLFIGHKLVPGRYGHVDPAPVWIPFVMVVIGLLDGDIAAVDVITKSLEPFCIIQNEIVDLVRFFQTPIRYLNRQLHNYLDNTAVFAVEGTKNLGTSIPFKSAAKIGNG